MRLRVDLTRGCVSHTYRRVDSAKPCATTLSALHSCRRTTVVSLVTSPMRGPHAPTNVRRLASFQIFFFFFLLLSRYPREPIIEQYRRLISHTPTQEALLV
jgi:hypothetical protein